MLLEMAIYGGQAGELVTGEEPGASGMLFRALGASYTGTETDAFKVLKTDLLVQLQHVHFYIFYTKHIFHQ